MAKIRYFIFIILLGLFGLAAPHTFGSSGGNADGGGIFSSLAFGGCGAGLSFQSDSFTNSLSAEEEQEAGGEEGTTGGGFSDGPIDIPVSIAKGIDTPDATLTEGVNLGGSSGLNLKTAKKGVKAVSTEESLQIIGYGAVGPEYYVMAANADDVTQTVVTTADAEGNFTLNVGGIGSVGDTFVVQTILDPLDPSVGSAPIYVTIQENTFSNTITNISDELDEDTFFAFNPVYGNRNTGGVTFTIIDALGTQSIGILPTSGGLPDPLPVDDSVLTYASQSWASDGSFLLYAANDLTIHALYADTGIDLVIESLTEDVNGKVLSREFVLCKDDNTVITTETRENGDGRVIWKKLDDFMHGTQLYDEPDTIPLSVACSYDSTFAVGFIEEATTNQAYLFDLTASAEEPEGLFTNTRYPQPPTMLRDDSGFVYAVDENKGFRQIHFFDLTDRIDVAITQGDYEHVSPVIPPRNDMVVYVKWLEEGSQLFAAYFQPGTGFQLTDGKPHFDPVASDLQDVITCKHEVNRVPQVTVIPLDYFDL